MTSTFILERQILQLYHGTNDDRFTLLDKPLWCGLKQQDAQSYASKRLITLQNIKPMHLINVMHPSFHDDFIAKVNSAFNTRNDYTMLRCYPLATFGLPDLETQLTVFGKQKDGVYPEDSIRYDSLKRNDCDIVKTYTPFYSHKHRLSLLDNDKKTVELLKRFYPGADGYIADGVWPSFHMGGMFHAETCIFHPDSTLKIVAITKTGGKKRGGALTNDVLGDLYETNIDPLPGFRADSCKIIINPLVWE